MDNSGGIKASDFCRELKLTNCLYAGNGAPIICENRGDCTLINSTIVDNDTTAVKVYGLASTNIDNCIIANNGGYGIIAYVDDQTEIPVQCSDVYNNTLGNYSVISDQTGLNGNISEDPMFCDPENGEYTISWVSPCTDFANSCGELMGVYGPACNKPNVWHVYADGSGDAPTIQAAIDSCADYDSVLVHPGTYTGEGNREITTRDKYVVIKGTDGPEVTIIDCEGYNGIVNINTWASPAPIVKGITITGALNGVVLSGAAMFMVDMIVSGNIQHGVYYPFIDDKNTSPSRLDAIFTNCTISHNGVNGIECETATVGSISMRGCSIDSNQVAGLNIIGADLSLKHCTFNGNPIGAHIAGWSEVSLVDSCLFENNETALIADDLADFNVYNSEFMGGGNGVAGGTYFGGDSVSNCTFENLTGYAFSGPAKIRNCVVQNCGGIAYAYGMSDDPGKLRFDGCRFVGNAKTFDGYSVELILTNSFIEGNTGDFTFDSPSSSIKIEYCVFANNSSTLTSGNFQRLSAYNSTFVGNTKNVFKFDAWEESDRLILKNCIIADNDGAAVTSVGWVTPFIIECCDFYNNSGGNFVNIDDQIGINGNISELIRCSAILIPPIQSAICLPVRRPITNARLSWAPDRSDAA